MGGQGQPRLLRSARKGPAHAGPGVARHARPPRCAHDAQVEQAERTVREIAALNQMFSTAVLQQSEQIEQLYAQAVEATQHIR